MVKKFLKPIMIFFPNSGRKQTAEGKSLYEGLIRICIVSFFVLTAALIFNFVIVNKAEAAAKTWDGGGIDTSWNTPENWNPNGVPLVGDDITIDNTSPKSVSIDTNISVSSINIVTSYVNSVLVNGDITVNTITIGKEKALNMGGHDLVVNTALNNYGDVDLGYGTDVIKVLTNQSSFKSTSDLLTINGNFNNWGTFDHNNGTVRLDSTLMTQSILGKNLTFNVLISTKAGVTITFATSEATINIIGNLTLIGSAGNEIKLRASASGGLFFINPSGAISVEFVDVKDSKNLAILPIDPSNSIDSGRTVNWWTAPATTTKTWTGNGADDNWSTPDNWSGGTLPDNTNDVEFNSTSSKNSIIDISFISQINSLTISAQYSGVFTQSNDLTVNSLYKQEGGTWTRSGDYSLFINGKLIQTGGLLGTNIITAQVTLGGVDETIYGNLENTDVTIIDKYKAVKALTINKLNILGNSSAELNMNTFNLIVQNETVVSGPGVGVHGELYNLGLGSLTLNGGLTNYDWVATMAGDVNVTGDVWNDGNIETDDGGDITIHGNVLASGDTFTDGGGDIYIYGDVNINWDIWTQSGGNIFIYGDLVVEGSFWTENGGNIYIDGDVNNNSAFWIQSSGDITISGNLINNDGWISTEGGGNLIVNGVFTNTNSGDVNTIAGNIIIQGLLVNDDSNIIIRQGGSLTVNNSVQNINGGDIISGLNSSITVTNTFINDLDSYLTGEYGSWSISELINNGTVDMTTGIFTGNITGGGSVNTPIVFIESPLAQGSDAILNSGDYFYLSGNLSLNSLVVNSGAALRLGSYTLNITGTTIIDGEIWSTSGDIVLSDDVTIDGNIWTESSGDILIEGNLLQGSSLWAEGSGNITVDGNVTDGYWIWTNSGNITIGGNYSSTYNRFSSLWSRQGNIDIIGDAVVSHDSFIWTESGNINLNSLLPYIYYGTNYYGSAYILGDGNLSIAQNLVSGVNRNTSGSVVYLRGTGDINLGGALTNENGFFYIIGSGEINIVGNVINGTKIANWPYFAIYTKDGGVIRFGGSVINNNGYIYTQDNGNIYFSDEVINDGGKIGVDVGVASFLGSINNIDNGVIEINGNGQLAVDGNVTNTTGAWLKGGNGSWNFNGNFINQSQGNIIAPSSNWYLYRDFTNLNASSDISLGSGFYHNNGSIILDGWSQAINGITTFHNILTANSPNLPSDFNFTSNLDIPIDGHTVETYNGYIYVLGGYDNDAGEYLDTVRYAQINTDGSLGAWTISLSTLNKTRGYHSSAVNNGYLYVIGGMDDSNDYDNVEYAKINPDGTLGSWIVSPNTLSSTLGYQASIAHAGFLYIIGGYDGTDTDRIEIAPLDPIDGSVGVFTVSPNTFTNGREELVTFVYNDRLYINGGYGDDNYADTQYADISSDGSLGIWSSDLNLLPIPISYSSVAVVDNKVFLIGGTDGTAWDDLDSVYYTLINIDGSISPWEELPSKIQYAATDHWVGTDGTYIYVIGGLWDGGNIDEVQYIKVVDELNPLQSPVAEKLVTVEGTVDVIGTVNIGCDLTNNFIFRIGTEDVNITGDFENNAFYSSIGTTFISGDLNNCGSFQIDGSGRIEVFGTAKNYGGQIYTYDGDLIFHEAVDSAGDGLNDTEISSDTGDITFNANLINRSGSDIHSAGGIIHILGTLTNDSGATLTNTTGYIIVDGAAVNSSGSTITNTGGMTLGNNLTVTSGSIVDCDGTADITIQGNLIVDTGGGLNINGFNLEVIGNTSVSNGGYIVYANNIDIGGNLINDGTIFSSSGSIEVGGSTNITINGTLMTNDTGKDIILHETLNDGSLMANGGNLSIYGSITASQYVNSKGPMYVTGSLSCSYQIHASDLFVGQNVTLAGGTDAYGGNIYTNGPIHIGGDFIADRGFINAGDGNLFIGGNATANGEEDQSGTGSDFFCGDIFIAGSLSSNHLYISNDDYDFYVGQDALFVGQIFTGDIFIGGSLGGDNIFISNGTHPIDIGINLDIKGEIFGGDLSVGGNLTSSNYISDSTGDVTSSWSMLGNIFVEGLTVNDSGSGITSNGDMHFVQNVTNKNNSYMRIDTITAEADFTNESGATVIGGNGDWDFNGNFINSNASVVATTGNWYIANDFTNNVTNTEGSTPPYFVHNNGTIIFDTVADAHISGNTVFNALTCTISGKNLIFEAGSYQYLDGKLTLIGNSQSPINLLSSEEENQWAIAPYGDIEVSYVNVRDSYNDNGVYIDPPNSTDSGNNDYWFTPVFTINSSIDVGGTISPLGNITVQEGGSQTYTITVNSNYHLAYLVVDEVELPAVKTYTFSDVYDNHSIRAVLCSGIGPCMVKNLDGSSESSFTGPQAFTVIEDKIFFSTFQSEDEYTLWCSDGTDAGTYSLSVGLYNISRLVNFNNKLYFTANHMGGQELWTSDGTVEGTYLIEGFYPVDPYHPDEVTIIWNLHVGNNVMYLIVSKGLWGDISLWKSDGTPGGTIFIKDLDDIGYSIVFGDSLFYTTCPGDDCDLWISDGTPGGTIVVEHFEDTYEISSFMVFKNEVYFEVQDGMGYKANYKTDGNVTTFLFESSNFGSIAVAGDCIFGTGWDAPNGNELWAMDGSVGGVEMVLDINSGPDGSHPNDFIEMNGILYFTADDGVHGREAWRSDGTAGGTYMIKEILPGVSGGILDFEKAGDNLYLYVVDGEDTYSLWTSDGTAEGTEINEILGARPPFSVMGGALYYVRDDEINGEELWYYNPNYVEPTYTIAATAGANGSIIPSGENTVTLGDNLTFDISPSSGYHILDVLVDGTSVGPVGSYTFNNIISNHTISATFASNDVPVVPPVVPPIIPPIIPPVVPPIHYHLVTASVGYFLPDRAIGIGTPYGEVASWQSWHSFYSIDGGMITLNLSLSPNSRVKDVLVDGVSVGPANTYTFYNIQANHTIQAIVVKYATISIQKLKHGEITPETTETDHEDGQRYSFTVAPNKGYKIEDVLDNNESINTDNCYIEDGIAYCSIVIGTETTQGKEFVTQHELSAKTRVLGVSNVTEPKKEVELGFFALVVQDIKLLLDDFGAILANVFDRAEQFIASTPPPVAYFFPYLLFILLGILIWRLGAQAKNEAFNAQKLVKLLDFEKNIATQKESFMVLSSHYLRTPMTIINSGVDLYLTINKVATATAVLLRGSVQAIADKVEFIFGEVDKNTYLKSINIPEVKQEKIRIYTSPLLILPIIFVGAIAVIANYLFETVASIDINIVNYLIQVTLFVILGVVLFSAFRKRETQKANKIKFDLLIAQQVAVDEARNRFISEVANELEKEVNILEGEISEVKDKTAVKEIQKGISDMKSMIAKFAFLASIEAGKAGLRNQKLDTSTLISQSLKAEESEIAAKGIKVNMPDNNIGVTADKQKLAFILSNLIDNAAKFNKESGQIDISAHNGGKDVEISIEDTGIGISEEGQKMLFQPFSHTTDLMKFNYQGMGTNLYIAKLVANYMGGDISIKSQENKGTRVTVMLPTG